MAAPRQQRIDPKSVPAPKARTRSGRPGGRPPGAPKVKKATVGDWIGAARPLTLPLSIAPVTLGAASAYAIAPDRGPAWPWPLALLCLAVAVFLQIGVNFANDYSDGIRGTDKYRVGPARLTASGAARPRTVLTVALVFFGLAAVAGLVIVVQTGHWWLLAVGAVAIVAAWFYTGGKRPYGYNALGEIVAFVFFGLVATIGTAFVLTGGIPFDSWVAGSAIGSFAAAALLVNNIRDREQDALAGKRTLAVLFGNLGSRILYAVLMLVPFVLLGWFVLLYSNTIFTYFALLAAAPAVLITLLAKTPAELIISLKLTSVTALGYALLLGWAIGF
ncbi:1,4-dihydroxy-2-naphthoate octaprenyltransferase [Leifsonia sp. AK011]|uniref:1,4-dihydroxy-2-naphthoate polyprenyltransferase n=1 Tax=Leifsonia sp. AK011 TaxID=2723075 RepID=UPI0015C9AE18|nr:1,4-dihydroxy-2-naphthoate polyprenyltransferase [Leifsonia sp. AK011]NYF08937.1 1,4-dihydroxy-2-naphthoate octaprenyltransferase [Leifsonia sp. AK011]